MGGIFRTPILEPVKTIVASATLTPNDSGVILVGNTGAMTVMLPPVAASAGVTYRFVKTTSSATAITLDGNASETINGAATFASMDAQWDCCSIYCNGSAWFITGKSIA